MKIKTHNIKYRLRLKKIAIEFMILKYKMKKTEKKIKKVEEKYAIVHIQ